jgi:hypothetical protein
MTGGEHGHVQPDLGDDGLGGHGAAPGDLIQPGYCGQHGRLGPVPAPGPVVPSASMPCATGIASISSLTRADSRPVRAVRAPVWSR